MPVKKKKKWYKSPLILTIISLIGGAILSFIPTYYFTIRAENIEYSKMITLKRPSVIMKILQGFLH